MSDERHSEVLGGLPRTRPHRRSDKRAANRATPATPAPETPLAAEPTPESEITAAPAITPEPKSEAAAPKANAAAPKSKPKPRTPATTKPAAKKAAAKKAAAKKATARSATANKATANTPAATGGTRLRQPAQPDGLPAQPRGTSRPAPRPSAPSAPPAPPTGGDILGTAVQAAAEIAEIGLSAGARAIRRAVSRLPRP